MLNENKCVICNVELKNPIMLGKTAPNMNKEEKLKGLLFSKGKVAVEYNRITEELCQEAMKPRAMPRTHRPNGGGA